MSRSEGNKGARGGRRSCLKAVTEAERRRRRRGGVFAPL